MKFDSFILAHAIKTDLFIYFFFFGNRRCIQWFVIMRINWLKKKKKWNLMKRCGGSSEINQMVYYSILISFLWFFVWSAFEWRWTKAVLAFYECKNISIIFFSSGGCWIYQLLLLKIGNLIKKESFRIDPTNKILTHLLI